MSLTALAVLLNVHDYRPDVIVLTAEHDVGYVLKRTERFTTTADDQAGVFALNINDGWVIGTRA